MSLTLPNLRDNQVISKPNLEWQGQHSNFGRKEAPIGYQRCRAPETVQLRRGVSRGTHSFCRLPASFGARLPVHRASSAQRAACSPGSAGDRTAWLGHTHSRQRRAHTPPLPTPHSSLSLLQTHTPTMCLTLREESSGFLKWFLTENRSDPRKKQGLLRRPVVPCFSWSLSAFLLFPVFTTSLPSPAPRACKYFPQHTWAKYFKQSKR